MMRAIFGYLTYLTIVPRGTTETGGSSWRVAEGGSPAKRDPGALRPAARVRPGLEIVRPDRPVEPAQPPTRARKSRGAQRESRPLQTNPCRLGGARRPRISLPQPSHSVPPIEPL